MSRSNGAFLIACTLLASSGCGLFAAAAPPRCDGDSDCPSGYTCASGNCLARGPGDAAASERPSADAGGALDRRGGDAPWDSGPRDAEGGCPLCPTCWGNTANFDFDDTALDFSTEVDLSGCSPTIDTSLEPGSMISDWCGPRPAPVVQTQAGGPSIVVVPMASLVVGAGSTVRLVGDKPVVIAVRGDALINGLIDASAQGTTPGAGGDLSTDGEIATAGGPIGSGDCAVFASGTGQGMDGTAYASLGGGGAGFRTNGGFGGGERPNFRCYSDPTDYDPMADGYECKPLCPDDACDNSFSRTTSRYQANNSAHYEVSPIYGLQAEDQSLTPLRGGCAGGRGKSRDSPTAYYGGSGGGAVQITATGTLTIGAGGIVSAGGGGGTVIGDHGSGSGGGSGGAILLEATAVDVKDAAGIRAHGGSGGGRRDGDDCYGTAENGHTADDSYATHSVPAGCISEGRGGLSCWDLTREACNGTAAEIASALDCTLPIADWPATTNAYPEGGNFTDDNGGGGGGGSGGVIIVRRLVGAGACP